MANADAGGGGWVGCGCGSACEPGGRERPGFRGVCGDSGKCGGAPGGNVPDVEIGGSGDLLLRGEVGAGAPPGTDRLTPVIDVLAPVLVARRAGEDGVRAVDVLDGLGEGESFDEEELRIGVGDLGWFVGP